MELVIVPLVMIAKYFSVGISIVDIPVRTVWRQVALSMTELEFFLSFCGSVFSDILPLNLHLMI